MLSLLALTILAAPNAELGIVMDRSMYAPGESISVSFVVRNRGKEPFAVATTLWDGALNAQLTYELWCGAKQYWPQLGENSMPQFYQVVHSNEVTSHRFSLAHSGTGVNVGFFNFSKASVAEHSGLKADPMPEVSNLAAGVYEIRVGYKFVGPFDNYEFTPSAKKMFDMSFRGELKASKKFTVK